MGGSANFGGMQSFVAKGGYGAAASGAMAKAAQKKIAEQKKKAEQKYIDEADTQKVSGRLKKEFGLGADAKQKELISGAQFGEAVLGKEGMGRLERDSRVGDILGRYEEMSKGLTDKETTAMKETGLQSIQAQTSAQQRALQAQLAASGVKGGAAGKQLTDVALGGMQQRLNLERDLILKDREAREVGLDKFSSALGDVKKFDLAQQAKEKNIAVQTGLGFAQLGAAERGAKMAAQSAEKAAAASRPSCHVAGTKVVMEDGSKKNIEDLKIGDHVLFGGEVLGVGQKKREEDLYERNGELFTASHLVWYTKAQEFIVAEKHPLCRRVYSEDYEVVYPIYTEHNVYYTSFINGDFGFEAMNKIEELEAQFEEKLNEEVLRRKE